MKAPFRALAVMAIIVVSAHGLLRSPRSLCPRLSADPSVPPSSPAPSSAPSSTAAGNNLLLSTLPLVLVALTSHPLPAAALDAATSPASPIASALVAYGHYLGLLLVAGSLTSERLLIKPGMSVEDEKLLGLADIVYGIAGVLVLGTGYLRVTQYGKGWEFYSHEPVFWVKLALFSVMGAASLFPTIKIIQRAVGIKKAEEGTGEAVPPLSAKLAKRMITLVNGELLAIASIPLTASLMSRGVGYSDGFPWQVGAGGVALTAVGLSAKYAKEALGWKEE